MNSNKKIKEKPNYTFAFNKIFTGSYLIYNLGNELINFIKTDDNRSKYGNKRLVYINPYGDRGKEAEEKTKYVLHVMETTYDNNTYYELIAISKISEIYVDGKKTNEKTLYNKNTQKEKEDYKNENIKFNGHFVGDIFNDPKAHLCSFFAEGLYEPKENVRILFKGNKESVSKNLEETHIIEEENHIFIINIECNLSRSRNLCYSKEIDLNILKQIVKSKYIKKVNDNINIPKDDEQCLAVICDRTNLEDSMSNQIAYFLSRDKKILEGFIKLLNDKEGANKETEKIIWDRKKNIKIIREHENIDILLESDTDIIVIENKIDSNIVEYSKDDKSIKRKAKPEDHILESSSLSEKELLKKYNSIEKKLSQLSKYYKYIMVDYENNKQIKKKKHFFILKPDYSSITKKDLEENYYNGDKYTIITYGDLYKTLQRYEGKYNPNGLKNSDPKATFLYDQFIQGLEYVKSSKAEQMRKTAYIRLKQRLNELDNK